MNGLTKAVAKEGGKYGIRCNAVCPSYTETPMTQALKEDKEKEAKIINAIPLRRKAQPVEIAQMILFFASKEASFVNGEIGDVDGGIVLDG
ncbi:3-ketoacyl-ACP reductase [Chlamydia trachomatis]|nr:3-ketoacyl-ACP reductase [Chlamydia trachomatis]